MLDDERGIIHHHLGSNKDLKHKFLNVTVVRHWKVQSTRFIWPFIYYVNFSNPFNLSELQFSTLENGVNYTNPYKASRLLVEVKQRTDEIDCKALARSVMNFLHLASRFQKIRKTYCGHPYVQYKIWNIWELRLYEQLSKFSVFSSFDFHAIYVSMVYIDTYHNYNFSSLYF